MIFQCVHTIDDDCRIIPLCQRQNEREREKDQIVSLTSKACSSCLSLSNIRVVVVIIPEIQEQNKNVTQSTRILIAMPSGKGKKEPGEVGDSGGMSGIKPLPLHVSSSPRRL